MSKSTFIHGSMKSGKSEYLLNLIKKNENNDNNSFIIFKPITDTRDGLAIRSRAKDFICTANPWMTGLNMEYIFYHFMKGFMNENKKTKLTVVIDEVHFLEENEIRYVYYFCNEHNIDLICAGLLTSFKQEVFKSSDFCLENFDEFFNFKATCDHCGKENSAIVNILTNNSEIVFEGETIQPGDKEYEVWCEECFGKIKPLFKSEV